MNDMTACQNKTRIIGVTSRPNGSTNGNIMLPIVTSAKKTEIAPRMIQNNHRTRRGGT